MALYHSTKGPVDYTVVGTPTIVDGVASGFSNSNYLDSQKFTGYNSDFEFNVAFSTSDAISNCGLLSGSSYLYGGILIADNKARFAVRTAETTYAQTFSVLSNVSLTANTSYIANAKREGNVLTLKLYKNGVLEDTATGDLTGVILSSDIAAIRIGRNSNGSFNGSIDLNETYIKVNGQPWFGICPVEVQKHQLMGPVGYTVVGSPTITDGVASGFGNGNYLMLQYALSNYIQPNQPFEIGVAFTVGSTEEESGHSPNAIFYTYNPGSTGYFRVGYSYFGARDTNNGSVLNFYPGISLQNNTYYRVIYKYENRTLSCIAYDINDNIVKQISWENQDLSIGAENGINIGYINSSSYVAGSIDLNETYIKVNGKLWFYQPANTKYIVKDDKLVWADPRIYLESDGHQYIQTDYTPVQGDEANVSFFKSSNLAGFQVVYSAGTGTYQYTMGQSVGTSEMNTYTKYFRTGAAPSLNVFTYALWANFSQHDGVSKLEVSGNTYEVTDEYQAPLDGNKTTLSLFRRRNGNSPFYGKMKAFSITNNSVLKIHLVPVPTGLQIGNFTVPSNGMFDIVNQQFYPNAGTGTFTIGRDE